MFGIHIGNTNASIALCKENGHADVITNEDGSRLTPAVVAVTDEEITVGSAAQSSNSNTKIYGNKFLMGKDSLNDTKYHINIGNVVKYNEINYCIPLEGKMRYFTPQNITMFILKELLVIAKTTLSVNKIKLSCVLLVPEHFSNEFCKKYREAAEAAGWQVLQIINEAAAAILALSLLDSRYEPTQNVIVYRLGGTSCEITSCEISDGMMSTLGSIHREDIGGNIFVDILSDFLAEEFFRKYKLDPREKKRSLEKLKRASQNCIFVLSNLPITNYFIESLHEGIDFSINLSRARLELLIKPLLEKCVEPLKILLDQLKFDESVDKVVLCGGATNTPGLKQSISNIFDKTVTQILTPNNPEEVLAIGGAKQAYYLNCNNCQDILPRSMDISLATTDLSYEICL